MSDSFAQESHLKVHFFDVGYGDAVLLEIPDDTHIMLDAGEAQYAGKIVQYLEAMGVDAIDYAIVTHPHDNHFGSFLKILEHFPIHQFYHNGQTHGAQEGYAELVSELQRRNVPIAVLGKGDQIPLANEDVIMKILHPQSLAGSVNENSLVSWLQYGDTSFLFTADIQPKQQDLILIEYPMLAKANCIQWPHHGGLLSSRFAELIPGKVFILSSGDNEYGKPFADQYDGKVYQTDQSGLIVVVSDGKNVKVIHE